MGRKKKEIASIALTDAERDELKKITRTMYDYQNMRLRIEGRLEKKADGTDRKSNGTEAKIAVSAYPDLVDMYDSVKEQEKHFKAVLESKVKRTPEWNGFLEGVKGCGPMMAAVLITEVDIAKADTVSSLWQYAGMNPGEVYGRKVKGSGKDKEIILTEDLVPADRPSSGYVIPYNKTLKTKMLGVLADCMIKANSQPYADMYRNYKNRLANSYKEYKPGRMWKDESAAHRDRAAKRYMLKQMLSDFWVAARKMYGLPVREPYAEEYLGKKHHKNEAIDQ